MTISSIEKEFDELTEDLKITSEVDDLYGENGKQGINEWLKNNSDKHLYEDEVYGEPMLDLSPDKIKSFYRQKINELEKEVREEEKQKWWTSCMYNVDTRTWNRIQGAYHALNKPVFKTNK